jgi:hypothetical protein
MKKALLLLMISLFLSSPVFCAPESIIIPQKDKIYSDLSFLSSTGLIKTVSSDYFGQNAITKPEAAAYIIEASVNLTFTADELTISILKKYEAVFSAEIDKIKNNKVEVENDERYTSAEMSEIQDNLAWLEKEYSFTRFTDATPVKMTGVIAARYMQLSSFGVANSNLTSMGSTNLAFYAEGGITDKIKFNTNLTFEVPQFDPAFGTDNPALGGSLKSIWLDVYTLGFDIYGFKVTAGFFWEDISTLVVAQGQSERTGIFARDKYAGEEGTKSHYETVFRNFSQNRDQRWSKQPFNGINMYKDGLFGRDTFKIMAGKPQETFGKNEYTQYGARYTHFRNFPFIRQAEWSLNAYNRSNDTKELEPFSTSDPKSMTSNITILGGDVKAVLFGLFKLKTEFERSKYYGSIEVAKGVTVPSFMQEGNAFYAHLSPVFMPKIIDLVLRYTMIDSGFVAPASAVSDMSYRAINAVNISKVDITPITYAADPTSLYNNMNKAEAHAYITVPFGILMVNYGVSAQIQKTGAVFQSSHWLNGTEWWQMFNSGYGWASTTYHSGFINYNMNRYAINVTGGGRADGILAGGKGGLVTDNNSNREYMVSSAVSGETQKYLSNVMMLLRLEVNRFIKLSSPLMLELYAEIIKLSNEADYLAWYDTKKLLAQNMMSATVIYNVIPKLSLIGFAGMERWGAETVIPKPIDYLDTAYGLGIDYDLAGRAFLYLRVKNFYHTDFQVRQNDLRGVSIWAELKSFF